MAEKKMGPVEESVARLRELRYMTRGPGAKRKTVYRSTTTLGPKGEIVSQVVDDLRTKVAKVATKKKAKKTKGRRR